MARTETPERRAVKRAVTARWRVTNQDRIRDAELRRKYGITAAQWDALLESQDGRCACCGTPDPGRRWDTDHDHDTGRLRGILCGECNRLIGRLGDRAELVIERCMEMVRYLERNPRRVFDVLAEYPADVARPSE